MGEPAPADRPSPETARRPAEETGGAPGEFCYCRNGAWSVSYGTMLSFIGSPT